MIASSLRSLICICLLFIFSLNLEAQGPGLGNLTYSSSELFKPISTLSLPKRSNNAQMFKGYLFLPSTYEKDVGGYLTFYNVSNPRSPVRVSSSFASGLREAHIQGFSSSYPGDYAVLQTVRGVVFYDFTDVTAPKRLGSIDLPMSSTTGTDSYEGPWWLVWQAPYVYVSSASAGINIVDATDVNAPKFVKNLPMDATGGFRCNSIGVVGNLMTVGTRGSGLTTFDISDPKNPVLLFTTRSTASAYSNTLNGNKVIAVPAKSIEIWDVSNPSSPFKSKSMAVGGGVGGYILMQDQFGHGGFSTKYSKVDLNTSTVIGNCVMPITGFDHDFCTPLGNLVVLGNDHNGTVGIVPHQTGPDRTGPSVNMVSPANGATNRKTTSRVGLTFTDMVDLGSVNNTSFIVRVKGTTTPLAGKYSGQHGTLQFWPSSPLAANTTYEVVVPAGKIKDWAGNTGPSSFVSTFSTGASISTPLVVTANDNQAALVNTVVNFSASASGSGTIQYSWDFGDGTPATTFSSASSASHSYSAPGHYLVKVTAKNASEQTSDSFIQTIHLPLTATAPTRSTSILLDVQSSTSKLVWSVNADSETVTAIDAGTFAKKWEVRVGKNPKALAKAPDGTIWVVNQKDATITVLSTTGATVQTISLPYASKPYGIAFSPNGSAAYVTLEGTGKLVKLSPSTRAILATIDVGPKPRGIAITHDSARIFVTRFISAADAGRVVEVNASTFAVTRTITLGFDNTPDDENNGRGVPNYIQSATISPDGGRLWVPSKKDNIARGLSRDGEPLTFDSTVRAIVSQISLSSSAEVIADRKDLDDRDLPVAVEFSKFGDYAFVALQGSAMIDVVDCYSGEHIATIPDVGIAPQGIVFNEDKTRLFVQNFMSRNIRVYDVTPILNRSGAGPTLLATVSTVSTELLAPTVLSGKRTFYHAEDRRMNLDGYLSCASCHLDGESDGRIWDFTNRGEGLRNTISLAGRAGMSHGLLHWTGNFDEVQDFEHDIRDSFGGLGFMSDADFTAANRNLPLGGRKSGFSPELDALAAYVSSLTEANRSPFRNSNGTLTTDGQAGKQLFNQLNCVQCHSGNQFTDTLTHNVGTIKPSSGKRLGQTLTGIETPTLKGIWETAPYLHDGSAATLLDVISTANNNNLHGNTAGLTATQQQQLVSYLQQIDDLELISQPPSVNISSPVSGSTFSEPASVNIAANASDPDGTISKVDFFAGSTLLGTDSTSPYSTIWNNVPAGVYGIQAVARDNSAVTTTSSTVNFTVVNTNSVPVTATLAAIADSYVRDGTSAASNFGTSTFLQIKLDSSVDNIRRSLLKFDVSSISGSVSSAKLRLYGSYQSTSTPVPVVCYSVTTDTWTETGVTWNNQPAVGASLSSVTVTATAQYYEWDVTSFVQSEKSSGQTLVSLLLKNDVVAGSHVQLNSDEASANKPQLVVVSNSAPNAAPSVSLTSPSSGATFMAPAAIGMAATASDSDGTINQVQFLAGTTLIGSDTSSPYGVTWSNVASGNYNLAAKATDNDGAAASSTSVNITVNSSSAPTGSLTGSKASQPATLNLSSEGTRDWSHWGLNAATDFNHKGSVTQQISNITKIGTGTVNRYTDGTMANSWTGGTPTASATSTTTGIYVASVGNGFQITVPADTTSRTLRLYCGLYKSRGRLQATLSDGSAAAFTDTTHESTTGSSNTMFTLNYKAASAGQSLTVKWTVDFSHDTSGAGTVGWQAATLQ